ncbi:hypothetical protein BJ684DRAFT_18113, partial [Piptocephalis cylindrospora]
MPEGASEPSFSSSGPSGSASGMSDGFGGSGQGTGASGFFHRIITHVKKGLSGEGLDEETEHDPYQEMDTDEGGERGGSRGHLDTSSPFRPSSAHPLSPYTKSKWKGRPLAPSPLSSPANYSRALGSGDEEEEEEEEEEDIHSPLPHQSHLAGPISHREPLLSGSDSATEAGLTSFIHDIPSVPSPPRSPTRSLFSISHDHLPSTPSWNVLNNTISPTLHNISARFADLPGIRLRRSSNLGLPTISSGSSSASSSTVSPSETPSVDTADETRPRTGAVSMHRSGSMNTALKNRLDRKGGISREYWMQDENAREVRERGGRVKSSAVAARMFIFLGSDMGMTGHFDENLGRMLTMPQMPMAEVDVAETDGEVEEDQMDEIGKEGQSENYSRGYLVPQRKARVPSGPQVSFQDESEYSVRRAETDPTLLLSEYGRPRPNDAADEEE